VRHHREGCLGGSERGEEQQDGRSKSAHGVGSRHL
jgi:hypothetical protein